MISIVFAGFSMAVAAVAAKPCAPAFETSVALTGAQARDTLIVEPLGPDCRDPAMFARVYDGQGRLIFVNVMRSDVFLDKSKFPRAQGSAAELARQQYYTEPGLTAGKLPQWGKDAKEPAQGEFAVFEPVVPQELYEQYRKQNRPLLILRLLFESGTIFVYDSEAKELVPLADFATGG